MNHQHFSGRRETGGLVSSTATYRGRLLSPSLSGDAHLEIEERGLLAETVEESSWFAYELIRSIVHQDYAIVIRSQEGETVISHLGDAGDWFFKELCESFNQRVQTVLQAKGPLLFEAKGPRYQYEDRQGNACFRIFEDAVMLLPPNMDARRLPLLFLSGMDSKNFTLTLRLTTGEHYEFSKLGEDQEPFERIVYEARRNQSAYHTQMISRLDGSLDRGQAMKAAKMIPQGLAVPLRDVRLSFPSLAEVLDQLLLASPIGEYYTALKEIGHEEDLAIGYKECTVSPDEEEEAAEEMQEGMESRDEEEEVAEELPEGSGQESRSAWALWAVIPSKDRSKAIVEFAFPQEKAATYLFDIEGSYEDFLMTLNRAFEATGLQREMLFLTDQELSQPANVNGLMLLERTPSLQTLRRQFAGRVIHRSLDSWKKNLLQQLG